MLNQLLTFAWRIFALLLVSLLGMKFYTALSIELYSIFYLLALVSLFYVLFLLEGLQIAGLQLKDHCEEAIVRFLGENSLGNDERTLRIAELYKNSFHSFLSGRQILVIMSVVSIASIISSIKLQQGMLNFFGVEQLYLVVNSPITNFLLSTLLPAWVSQLLPQFIADNRSIGFVTLPGAELITRLAIQLDKFHASRPAFDLLDWARRSTTFSMKEEIHIGRKRFFESLASHIGISRDKVLVVVCGDMVTERSTYHIRKEKLITLRHKIRPQSETEEFDITLSTEVEITIGTPTITKNYDRGGLFYMIEVALSFNEEENDSYAEISVINEYKHKGMTASGSELIMFETDIPTRTVSIILMPDKNQKISGVSVEAYHYTQRKSYDDDSFAYGVVDVSSDNNNNYRIDIDYPLYGIEYQITYHHQFMENGSEHELSNGRCEMRVKRHSEGEHDNSNILHFTLSTQGLDANTHLKKNSSELLCH